MSLWSQITVTGFVVICAWLLIDTAWRNCLTAKERWIATAQTVLFLNASALVLVLLWTLHA